MTCSTCRHHLAMGQIGVAKAAKAVCRRYPPQTHFIVVLRDGLQGPRPVEEQRSAFPAVMPDWICGEYAPLLVS